MVPMGLTEFLMARIAEDEEAAGAVKDIGTDVWGVEVTHQSPDLDPAVTRWTDDERTTLAQHFDRDRVLAVCDVTRLIVAMHNAYEGWQRRGGPTEVLGVGRARPEERVAHAD